MITSKKKGQISVEALIIVGVLVVGGIIFATVFLSQMNNQAKQASDLSGLTDSFLDDLGGWGTPGPGSGPGTTPSCGNGVCESHLGENNNNCSDDCGAMGDFIIQLGPTTPSEINTSFGVRVIMSNGTGLSNEIIKKIYIEKNNGFLFEDTMACSYNGTYDSEFITAIPFNNNEAVLNFSCNAAGNYKFIIDAGISGQSEISYNDTKEKIKIITSTIPPIDGSFNVLIESPTAGLQDIDKLLILSSKTDPLQTDPLSCVWTAKDKQGNSEIISQSCNSIIDPTVYFTAGQNYTLYLTASTQNHSAIDKKEIFFVSNTDLGAKIFFTPPNSSIVGERFIAEFISTTAISPPNTLSRLVIDPRQANCTNKLNEIKTYEIFNDVGDKQLIYGYIFEVSCLNSIPINVGGQIYNLKNEILDQASSNYSIVLPSPNPTINFDLFLDLITEDEESIDADETIVELKEKKENVLYFATTTQGTNYRINAGQKFYIKPTIFDDPNNSINQCITTIATQANPTVPVRYFGPTDCNQAFFGSLNNSGTYTIKVQGIRSQGNIYKNKSLQVDAVPFFITGLNPNDGSTVLSNITEFKVYLSNATNTIANVSLELFKKSLEPNADFSKQEDITNSLYFAALPTDYTQQSVGNINCNAQYTECTASVVDVGGSLSAGQYILKAIAKNTQDEIQSIAYSRFVSLEEPEAVVILGSDPVYHGTENKFYALFRNSVTGGFIYSHPDKCYWNNNDSSNFLTWEEEGCEVNFTPWKLTTGNQSLIGVQARDITETINMSAIAKEVDVTEESLIAFPSSVLMADANTSNPNFGVHLKGSDVNFVLLQKKSATDYEILNSAFTCSWKYKLSTSSTWINLSGTNCDSSIPESQNLGIGVYNLSVDVKYNNATIYTEASQFKIRECVVGGNRCQYNGVCEADGRCSYVRFPGVSMDLAKNYITDINLQTYSSYLMQWKYPPISGIGHNCFESQAYGSDNGFVCTSIARASESSSALYKEWLINGDLDLRSVRYNNSEINLSNNYCVSSISGGSSVLSSCEAGYQNCKKLDPIFINLVNPNPGATQPVSRLLVTATGSYQSLGTTIEINTQTENNIHTSLGESSNITIIANGLATENTKIISGSVIGYPNTSAQIKLTKLIYYSLNSNKNIRRIGLQNCTNLSPAENGQDYNYTQSNCSYLSLANIQSYLTEGSLISTQINGVNYDYYYDYPQIARKDGKVAIVGPRYVLNDGNLLLAETYILYNNNINTNNWELVVTSDLRHLPVEARGNTLVFDSENNIHYSYLSGSMSKINDNGKLILINNLENSSSLPMELIFNLNNKKLEIKSVFPNPGFENSQKNYFIGEATGSAYVAQSYETTVATNNLSTIEQFKFYSQQSINLDKNWMAQIWVSYPIANVTGAYVNGDPNRKVIRISFSNDNGKHWSAPIDLISNVSTFVNTTRKMHTLNSGSVLGYVTISKDIIKINESTGRIALNYWSYYSGSADADYQLIYPNSVVFDVNFGALSLSYGQQDYANYLLKDTTGQLVNTKAGEINFSTYRKPYIISKISNDFNFTDWEYINNNCVLFNYHTNISENMLNNTSCILQYEQIFTPKIIKVTANVNDDVYGCGAIQPPPVGGGVGDLSFCFKEGTKVYTPEGYKYIEAIKSGDKVYSLNEKKNALEVVTVKTPLIHKNTKNNILDLYKITLSNKVVLYVTDNHSFYVSEIKDYRQLKDIKNNEKLLYYNINNKQFDEINIIDRELQTAEETYYNLSLVENHNYLAEGVVVHNDRKPLRPNFFETDLFGHVSYQSEAGGFNWFDMLDVAETIINNPAVVIVPGSYTMYVPGGEMTGFAVAMYNSTGLWIASTVNWPDGTTTIILAGNGGYYQFGPGNFGNSFPCLNC